MFISFYKKGVGAVISETASVTQEYNRKKWFVFFSITFGYGFYYICRLSLNVIKKPLVDNGIFSASELGIIGSALFFTYAFGKLVNGILSDRVNVRKFMAIGLLVSAMANLALGFTTWFWFFFFLWGINGWFQSFGAPSSVVSISHWFGGKERGSFYGMWATSHNIGEAITFIGTAFVVSYLGWRWGFRVAGLSGIFMAMLIYRFLYERPDVYGLPSPIKSDGQNANKSLGAHQWEVVKNPAVWILALSSACFYVTRYAINSWGVFFLETEKGYSTIEASSIISVNAIAGIFGTFFSGILSDKLFGGQRKVPALIFGILYSLSTAMFIYLPPNIMTDTLSMVFFGLALGVLIVYLGGLMAVDICSKETSGTALGVVGVASYLGAAVQDILSGYFIENEKEVLGGIDVYHFEWAGMMWLTAAILSFILPLFIWKNRFTND